MFIHGARTMADESVCIYYGTWKIVAFDSSISSVEGLGIEGTEFCLDDGGDILWKVTGEEIDAGVPFFNSETFEIFHGITPTLKLFSSDAGHIVEFKMDLKSNDCLHLTYENWFTLKCQRVSHSNPKTDSRFSFINALEEGYFTDYSLITDKGKELKAHQTILSLSNPQLNWNQCPSLLNGLPEDVLAVILHYLYSECLPSTLTEETAKQCLQSVAKISGFERIAELCEMFLKSRALKHQITTLINDMHTCASNIVDYFTGKLTDNGGGGSPQRNSTSPTENVGGGDVSGRVVIESLAGNPSKLCYVLKQSLQECAIAGAKLLILCDLFARRKNELSRAERHEIIKYARSRLPIFMHQLHKLLEVARQAFGDMPTSQQHEMAMQLVPQIEIALETMSQFVIETKTALEQIIATSNPNAKTPNSGERVGKKPVRDVFGRSLRHVLHMREMMKLRNFYDKITLSFMNLMQNKAHFTSMTPSNKVRSVAKTLERIIDELPSFLVRLEEFMVTLDDKLTWRDWKYTVKLGTSKVAWMLQKLVSHRTSLRSMILQTSDMVHREQFTQSMVLLGLLDSPQEQENQATTSTLTKPLIPTNYLHSRANPLESLCVPPLAADSTLAKNAMSLLKSGSGADMIFEIVCVEDVSDTVIDHTLGEPVDHTTSEHEIEVFPIPAHRVIVASRCDWFRRALLSGMKECIDKKILIRNTSPALFRIFLDYLYGGVLDSAGFRTDQLVELMLLGDQYEMDSLKHFCETALKSRINHDSVLFLLSVADQYNAKMLRTASMEFIIVNPDVIGSEVFYELPDDLQSEVEYLISWEDARCEKGEYRGGKKSLKTEGANYHSCCHFPNEELDEMIAGMHLNSREVEFSDSNSLEEVPLTQDSTQLESCVASLRDIVGESVPREELVRISLAADYDVNRALNFFFS